MIDIITQKSTGFIPKHITPDQAKDTGMAMVLICLLVGYFGEKQSCFGLAIVLLLLNMIRPQLYKPVAVVWLGLSNVLGTVVSKIFLSILFFVLVTPIGCLRKLFGADSLQLKKWKKSRDSVFRNRDHLFTSKDIEHPY